MPRSLRTSTAALLPAMAAVSTVLLAGLSVWPSLAAPAARKASATQPVVPRRADVRLRPPLCLSSSPFPPNLPSFPLSALAPALRFWSAGGLRMGVYAMLPGERFSRLSMVQ